MHRLATVFYLLVLTFGFRASAQDKLSASVSVIGESLFFTRANTNAALPLSVGSVSTFGIGDSIRTGDNGRAVIHLSDDAAILLLPNTTYTVVDFAFDERGTQTFIGQIAGIAIHQLADSSLRYQLLTTSFEVTTTTNEANFGVWALPDSPSLQGVTTLGGGVTVSTDSTSYILTASTGVLPILIDELVELDGLLHPVQIADTVALCEGVVSTNGGAGLRLRGGAALDYLIVGLLQDGQEVQIIGTTENGLWYRIPDLTSYGWMFSNLIEADCDELPIFENLIREVPERIDDVSESELDFLTPYYGLPTNNITFYR